MKVVLFNGSPRAKGNTHHCLGIVMEEIKEAGIECEYIWMGAEKLRGCMACYKCKMNQDLKCSQTSDKMNEYIAKILDADGIVIGSPTYFSDVSTNVKALIERVGFVARANGNLLKHKVGAAVVAVRRQGANHVFSSINFFFLIAEMFVVGSSYWNLGMGLNPGDIMNDEEGVETFKNLGKNMVFLLEKLKN
ncbi:MAG: flavodoxin family protein [Promethearchaeota archaeon]